MLLFPAVRDLGGIDRRRLSCSACLSAGLIGGYFVEQRRDRLTVVVELLAANRHSHAF